MAAKRDDFNISAAEIAAEKFDDSLCADNAKACKSLFKSFARDFFGSVVHELDAIGGSVSDQHDV